MVNGRSAAITLLRVRLTFGVARFQRPTLLLRIVRLHRPVPRVLRQFQQESLRPDLRNRVDRSLRNQKHKVTQHPVRRGAPRPSAPRTSRGSPFPTKLLSASPPISTYGHRHSRVRSAETTMQPAAGT